MVTFLTTREMQDLINVDRSTVYRMAEDGRLPGIKVGRQWRFPAARVAEQLGIEAKSGPHELLFHNRVTIGMLYLAAVSISKPPIPSPPSPDTTMTCLPGRPSCTPIPIPTP